MTEDNQIPNIREILLGLIMLNLSLFNAFILLLSINCFATDKVIYGDDNRVDAYAHGDNLLKKLSSSTAAMMSKGWLKKQEDGNFFLFRAQSMKKTHNTCEDEVFNSQPIAATCTGFLVAEDLLVTAGHCMEASDKCPDYFWIFDYKMKNESEISYIFPPSNIYECQEVLELKMNPTTKEDYALIKLKRKVLDRKPLRYRTKGSISHEAKLVLMGYPAGLPLKIADGGTIIDNKESVYFKTNLDAYGGNSGSPVFNQATGVVEGILSSGEADWEYQEGDYDEWTLESGCYLSRRCKANECAGEDVTRISNIKALRK